MTGTFTRVLSLAAIGVGLSATGGCLAPPATNNTSGVNAVPSTTPTLTPAPGVRAAKIIFKVPTGGNDSGSFDAPNSGGTNPANVLGHGAVRVFNPDGTLLSTSGPGSSTWPKWLTGVEVGISGSNNSAAKNENCAKFAAATDTIGKCYDLADADGDGVTAWDCSAPAGYFRVSEYDCLTGDGTVADTISDGNGTSNDGVFVRAYFSREAANLDPSENIMAVVEYSASALTTPQAVTSCVDLSGNFSPESCSDVTWKAFLRKTATDTTVPSPFLMMIPPTVGVVSKSNELGGTGITTRQIFLPLASDSTLQVFQLSRIKSRRQKNDTDLIATCSAAGVGAGNSPLCMGVILYSITFYRI